MMIRFLGILLLITLPSALCFGQGDNVPQEYLVKAKYILNMPLFTEMPPWSSNDTSFTVCLIGNTPLEDVLMASKGSLIKNRPLTIRRVEDLSHAGSCQMLFIASSERNRLQTLLPEANRRRIMTISDMRDFARLGGMVGLLIVDSRITFDLNLSAASKANISFSSHLLKLARDVIR